MSLLLVTPDYISHYLPLVALGHLWRTNGEDVIVATGPSLAGRIRKDGFTHRELELTPAANPGLVLTERLSPERRETIESTLKASRGGMIAMLRYQAEHRLCDLLHKPREVHQQMQTILSELRPRTIICVHLSFNATLALLAIGVPFATFVTAHPAQLPAPCEVYGFPHVRPEMFGGTRDELRQLAVLCERVEATFTKRFNELGQSFSSTFTPLSNGLRATSPRLILHHYVDSLIAYRRTLLPRHAAMLGSTVRDESIDAESDTWLRSVSHDRPRVFLSLGSFFSLRTDVFERVIAAISRNGFQAVVAAGAFDRGSVELPADWHVRKWLPQAGILRHCDLTICHGGNNTVMESLTAGVPLLVGPFSSDQFASAADVERHQLGTVFDPNSADIEDIQEAMYRALNTTDRVARLGRELRARPGAVKAWTLCEEKLHT